MLLNQLPVKKQGHIYDEILALRAREVELRKCFTDDCNEFDLEMRSQIRRVLSADRLPADIPNNPLDSAPMGTVASNDNFDAIKSWAP